MDTSDAGSVGDATHGAPPAPSALPNEKRKAEDTGGEETVCVSASPGFEDGSPIRDVDGYPTVPRSATLPQCVDSALVNFDKKRRTAETSDLPYGADAGVFRVPTQEEAAS